MKYVPLHLHTEYSHNTTGMKIANIFKYMAENEIPAFAITDLGVMSGCADIFITKNQLLKSKNGTNLKKKIETIKPIIGCEVFVYDGDISERDLHKKSYHLILLAKNKTGYQNLCKLNSIGYLEGFYVTPRINNELLERHKEGLICLSAGLTGKISGKILDNNIQEAFETAKYYQNLFGEDYYIELQEDNSNKAEGINKYLIEIAKQLNIKTVITDNYQIKNIPELRKNFAWMQENYFNECIKITEEIANKCNFEFDKQELGKVQKYIPKYSCQKELSETDYLNELCQKGLNEKYSGKIPDDIMAQYQKEKEIINKAGIESWFLIVWDILNYAKEEGISFNKPDSVIFNSITAYVLGIVKDMPSNLRISNKIINATTMPKINIEITNCDLFGLLIDYIFEKWGEKYVAPAFSKRVKKPMINTKASIIIAPIPLDEIIPLKMAKDGNATSQYCEKAIEAMGLFTIHFKQVSFD